MDGWTHGGLSSRLLCAWVTFGLRPPRFVERLWVRNVCFEDFGLLLKSKKSKMSICYPSAMNDFPCIAEQNTTQNVSVAIQKLSFAPQYILHSLCTKSNQSKYFANICRIARGVYLQLSIPRHDFHFILSELLPTRKQQKLYFNWHSSFSISAGWTDLFVISPPLSHTQQSKQYTIKSVNCAACTHNANNTQGSKSMWMGSHTCQHSKVRIGTLARSVSRHSHPQYVSMCTKTQMGM